MTTKKELRRAADQLEACYFQGWHLTLLADCVALLLREEARRWAKR